MSKTRLLMTVEEAVHKHDKWLEIRNTGIGGSDAGVIMGLNPYKSRLRLWMEKTGKTEQPDLSDNESVYWGTKLEDVVAEYFTEKTGKKVRRCGTLQSVEHPWLLANVDRLIIGEDAGLEIKTAGVGQSKLWKDDEIPDSYYAQCQHYMMVTGCEKWYIATLIGGNKGLIKEIPRNDAFIDDMFHKEAAFWTLVENDTMPEVNDGLEDTADALLELYPQAKPEAYAELECTDEIEKIFELYEEAKQAKEQYENLENECKNKIKSLVGDNEYCKIGDKHKATWSNTAGRVTLDTKALQKDLPDVYEKYKKVGKASRRFSMK